MTSLNIPPSANISDALREALQAASRPFCTAGDLTLGSERLTLYFTKDDGHAQAIQFPLTSQDAIMPLINACKQAPFGRGTKPVLDPEYRRALMLPADRFAVSPAMSIDPYVMGILDEIDDRLLARSGRGIVARLEKLDVYSPGDFFKGHVDTPRSEKMFGTLLVNFPLTHKGGQMVLHAPNADMEEESTRNVAGAEPARGSMGDKYMTSWGDNMRMSWVAFFSDCPHEVLPVESGYRVTLAYNLFYMDSKLEGKDVRQITQPMVTRIADALKAPGQFGGTKPSLAVHLQHRYPVSLDKREANEVKNCLKGCDEIVYQALLQAGANISFQFVGQDDFIDGGMYMRSKGKTDHRVPVLVGSPGDEKEAQFSHLAYGNEATPEATYKSICMIAEAPSRSATSKWSKTSAHQ